MPGWDGSNSPSLRKMDLNNPRARFGAAKKSFNMNNILGDPFSLATLGVAVGGWLIAFISSIVADVDQAYPNFCWWTIVYVLFCIAGVFVTVATDSVATYHVAMVGFLSAALVFCTSSVNSLIYSSASSKEAGAAGFILLSMVSIIWIFYFGAQPQSSHRQVIDSFALHKENALGRNSRHMTQSYRPETMHSANQPQPMYNSAALAGFETSSPVTGQAANRYSEPKNEGPANPNPPSQMLQTQQSQPQLPHQTSLSALPPVQPPQQLQSTDSTLTQPAEYPYRAKAIYSYEANPDDPNEISFTKHEILDVSDVSGRWWQAKKASGETGIAPSNYLILL